MKVYAYARCGTCRRALEFLRERGIGHEVIPIRERPPTKTELKRMLKFYPGNLRKLFNTSGQDYKSMKLKNRISTMSEGEAIDLLSRNGNLVKRPFVLTAAGGIVGFKPEEWEEFNKAALVP